MAVLMKRSTNIAPLSLSTSYLIGSAFIGISMITLNSSGARAPGVTLCRLMADVAAKGTFDVKPPPNRGIALPDPQAGEPVSASLNIRGFAQARALRHAGQQVQAMN